MSNASESNPNNCQECDHWKMQRTIEKNDPQAMPLHCYHFRDPYPEVCMQHTARKINFFSGGPNFPIQTSINEMMRDLAEEFSFRGDAM